MFVENTDMHITFSHVCGNKIAACHIYEDAFPTCQLQDRKTFYNTHQSLRERETFVLAAAEKEDTRLNMDNVILDDVAELPGISIWGNTAAQAISHLTVLLSSV
jgi:hypothetical protein